MKQGQLKKKKNLWQGRSIPRIIAFDENLDINKNYNSRKICCRNK